MTEEIFRDEPYRREADARVASVDAAGVRLDRTVFYPRGGGQAGDAGTLALADGTALVIADTVKGDAAGEIVHVPAPGQEAILARLGPGDPVTARIDWEAPAPPHALPHGHAPAVRHRAAPDQRVLDHGAVRAPGLRHGGAAGARGAERELARLVAEAHDVRTAWITDAELDAKPELVRTMSVKPPRGLGRVRLLEIEGVDLQPCGGTHVANTREIGALRVAKIEKKSARTRRVVLEFADA